ncbi:MAG: hypothetical protein ACRCXZ_05850 [Patescibacteria group bacterium]
MNFLVNILVLAATIYYGYATLNGASGHDAFSSIPLTSILILGVFSIVAEFFAKILSLLVATVTSIFTFGIGLVFWIFAYSAFAGWLTLQILTHFTQYTGFVYDFNQIWWVNIIIFMLIGWSPSTSSSSSSSSND